MFAFKKRLLEYKWNRMPRITILFLFSFIVAMDTPFVFSNDLKFRLARHAAFWTVMIVYQSGVDFIVPTFFEGAQYDVLRHSFQLVIVYLPGQLILVYSLLYFIIPQYLLKSRYVSSILLLIVSCVLAGLVNEFSYRFLSNETFMLFPATGKHSLGMHRVLGVAGFASCIKFMKYWYEKEYLNSILEKEKLKAELQSLKAQVHPHFLFNTLNNIYSVTQDTSPQASDMLLRLSALLRYILYECNKPEIKLTQEFKIMNAYISLESIRYSEKLDVNIQFPENTENLLIAPLLLLPLIENCFKHGTSKMLDQPWINIQADLKENILSIKLINSKPDRAPSDDVPDGIGLSNVRKRLELLYPGKYDLKIIPEADLFVVALKIELHMISSLQSNEQIR